MSSVILLYTLGLGLLIVLSWPGCFPRFFAGIFTDKILSFISAWHWKYINCWLHIWQNSRRCYKRKRHSVLWRWGGGKQTACTFLLASSLDHPSNKCFSRGGHFQHLFPLILSQHLSNCGQFSSLRAGVNCCLYLQEHTLHTLQVAAKHWNVPTYMHR